MDSRKHRKALPMGRVLLILGVLLTPSVFFFLEAQAFVRITVPSGAGVFWPDAQATLNLRLGCPATPLTNWGPCWDDAAADAAARWNGAAVRFRFSIQSPAVSADPCAHFDGVNTAAFQSSVCGMAFGDGLAVTVSVANAATGTLVDTDVFFDAGRPWSTYPGPLQVSSIDFHRVAIHEFGHVLGLAHPDAAGQSVVAIMNSHVSDIDTLQSDDIAGVNAIYPSTTAPTGALENPRQGSTVSGISTISGWVCNATQVELQIDGFPVQAAYGTSRKDTIPVCGDENNGFGLLINWNVLGNGPRTIVAFADGVEFARATFTVATLGQEFLTGASGTFLVPNFAGRNVIIQWQESLQNFGIVGTQ